MIYERGKIKTNTTELQKIRENYEQLYVNKFTT